MMSDDSLQGRNPVLDLLIHCFNVLDEIQFVVHGDSEVFVAVHHWNSMYFSSGCALSLVLEDL
jgi:hypothetical protein